MGWPVPWTGMVLFMDYKTMFLSKWMVELTCYTSIFYHLKSKKVPHEIKNCKYSDSITTSQLRKDQNRIFNSLQQSKAQVLYCFRQLSTESESDLFIQGLGWSYLLSEWIGLGLDLLAQLTNELDVVWVFLLFDLLTWPKLDQTWAITIQAFNLRENRPVNYGYGLTFYLLDWAQVDIFNPSNKWVGFELRLYIRFIVVASGSPRNLIHYHNFISFTWNKKEENFNPTNKIWNVPNVTRQVYLWSGFKAPKSSKALGKKCPYALFYKLRYPKQQNFFIKKKGKVFLATVYKACERGLQNPWTRVLASQLFPFISRKYPYSCIHGSSCSNAKSSQH